MQLNILHRIPESYEAVSVPHIHTRKKKERKKKEDTESIWRSESQIGPK